MFYVVGLLLLTNCINTCYGEYPDSGISSDDDLDKLRERIMFPIGRPSLVNKRSATTSTFSPPTIANETLSRIRRRQSSSDIFQCQNGKNIKSIFECDKDNDCEDNSDEQSCPYNYGYNQVCSKTEFQCTNMNCITRDKFCDGYFDCTDNSDEYDGCNKELNCEGKYQCTNGYCLAKEWVCDGMKDCLDGSDELHCISIGCTIENNRYMCKNKKCISLDFICDGEIDCYDKSDEGDACDNTTISCLSAGCSHNCIITPDGPVCFCPQGYKLQNNSRCEDINECAVYGICDQQCVNTEGSYMCICQTGYTLQTDMASCKANGDEASIIISLGSEIRGMYLDSKIKYTIATEVNYATNVAVNGKYIYWSENDKTIIKGTEDGEREVILTTGLGKLSDITVDWITGNIYFTDEDNMYIGICDNNGTYCTILINEETRRPTGIALLATNGTMYWCDSSYKPYIAMAGMDGKDVTLFVTKKIKYPNSLTIDYPNNRLYWVDSDLGSIESIKLDGNDRKIISRKMRLYPTSLAIFENRLYWNESSNTNYENAYTIKYCGVFSGCHFENLITSHSNIYDVKINHPTIKPQGQNACFSNPCSQLCMLNRNKSYTCGCTMDKILNSDGHTCQDTKERQHVTIVADGTFIDYYHLLLGKPKIITSITLKHITAITYDSLSATILASNSITNNIFRYNPISGEIKNLLSMNITSLGGMAFDYIGNNLYVTNKEQNTVEVHSLMTKAKKIFYLGEEPYDIALAPEEGIMFIVIKEDDRYRIDKMQMNGMSKRSLFVESNFLRGPKVSLYYDMDDKKIYWSDQYTGYIERASLTGFDYQVLRTKLHEPISLTIAGEYIFWTTRQSNLLYWTNKNIISQNNEDFIDYIPEKTEISHIISLYKIDTQKEYGCRKNNGNCSHVCLPSPETSYLCACPPQMVLSADNHTCVVQYTCSLGDIKCNKHDVCIKWNQWCNGIKDCPDGEDEPTDCKKSTFTGSFINHMPLMP